MSDSNKVLSSSDHNKKRIIYYDHSRKNERQDGFRDGCATITDADIHKPINENKEIDLILPVNTYHSLFGLGLIEKLQHLPMEFGPIDQSEEAMLLPEGLDEGANIIDEFIRSLENKEYDLYCGGQNRPEKIEYRIKIDYKELKRSLIELVDFIKHAKREDKAIQLWL